MLKNLPIFTICAIFCAVSTTLLADADVQSGINQFAKCAACHSLQPGNHLSGPSLHNLLGRRAGTADGFVYSLEMEQSNIVWTADSLSAFINNPMEFVPGTVMAFGGIRNPEQRRVLVDYLVELGSPGPKPARNLEN